MSEFENANVLVMLDAVAREILTRGIDLLAAGSASVEDCAAAQMVCHDQRENPALAELIAKYTMLADKETGGIFSATLDSWSAPKQ